MPFSPPEISFPVDWNPDNHTGPTYRVGILTTPIAANEWDALGVQGTIQLRVVNVGVDPVGGHTSEGAVALAAADARVQDLLNRLAAAFEGSEWQLGASEKTNVSRQEISADAAPDETPEA